LRSEFFGLVRKYADAWNRHDLNALNFLYAINAVREGPGGVRQEGIAVLREYNERLLRAFPDLTWEYHHEFTAENHGVLEWTMRGTHKGAFETAWGSLPATGKSVRYSGILVWEIDERGYIIRERLFPDTAGLMAQLGALRIPVAA